VFTAWLAAQLVHKGAHQKDAATSDAFFGGIEVGHRGQVKRGALVDEQDFNSVCPEEALDLQRRIGLAAVGVPDDIVGGLVGGEDNGVRGFFVKTRHLADRLDERPSQGQQPQVARKGQGPRRLLRHPLNSSGSILADTLIGESWWIIDVKENRRKAECFFRERFATA
jgi:hypothetical protein